MTAQLSNSDILAKVVGTTYMAAYVMEMRDRRGAFGEWPARNRPLDPRSGRRERAATSSGRATTALED